MSNPLIRSIEHFVLLEPEKEEKIVTKEEAIQWLKNWLLKIDKLTIKERVDFEKKEQLESFLENTCELEITPGYIVRWFAVRIDNH